MSATVQYITDISSTSGQTTYTFNGVSLGSPSADRKVVLCVETRKTGTGLCEIVSASIGGVAATPVFQQASAPSGTVNYAGIISADVPSGDTGDISITFSVPVLRVGVQVYAVTGVPYQSNASLLEHPSVSLDVPAGGVAIGCLAVASNQSFDWSGIDQDHIDLIGGSLRVASASRVYETASAGQTLSITRTSGTWSSPVGVFATWGPESSGGDPDPIEASLSDIELTPEVESATPTTEFESTLSDASAAIRVESATPTTSFESSPEDASAAIQVESAAPTTSFTATLHDIVISPEVESVTASAGQPATLGIVSQAIEVEAMVATTAYAATLHDIELPLAVEHAEPSFTEIPQTNLSDLSLAIEVEQMTPVISYTASLYDISLPLEVFSGDASQPTTGSIFGLKTASGYFFLKV